MVKVGWTALYIKASVVSAGLVLLGRTRSLLGRGFTRKIKPYFLRKIKVKNKMSSAAYLFLTSLTKVITMDVLQGSKLKQETIYSSTIYPINILHVFSARDKNR